MPSTTSIMKQGMNFLQYIEFKLDKMKARKGQLVKRDEIWEVSISLSMYHTQLLS